MSGEASPATPATAVLALELVYDGVAALFAADEAEGALHIDQPFGWKEPLRQIQTDRIVWVPGDASSSVGVIAGARRPGRNPRPLLTLVERFRVLIEAADRSAPQSERAQYRAARLLYDRWIRAMHLTCWDFKGDGNGLGGYTILDQRWAAPPDRAEGRRGAAIWVTGAIQAAIPDETLEFPDPTQVTGNFEADLTGDSTVDPAHTTPETLTTPDP